MKKHIALLLALTITAGTLAACAAGVPSSSPSHVPLSSSVASAPPSSLPVSSLPPSSTSVVPAFPIQEANTYTLLSQDDEFSTYQYTIGTKYSNIGVYSFSIMLPSSWYFDNGSNTYAYNDTQNIAAMVIGGIDKFLSPDELIAQSPEEDWNEFTTLLDVGSYSCGDGRLVSYLYVKSTYDNLWYIYDYDVVIDDYDTGTVEDNGLRLIFYYEEYNPDVDIPIQKAIIDSIETIAVY